MWGRASCKSSISRGKFGRYASPCLHNLKLCIFGCRWDFIEEVTKLTVTQPVSELGWRTAGVSCVVNVFLQNWTVVPGEYAIPPWMFPISVTSRNLDAPREGTMSCKQVVYCYWQGRKQGWIHSRRDSVCELPLWLSTVGPLCEHPTYEILDSGSLQSTAQQQKWETLP